MGGVDGTGGWGRGDWWAGWMGLVGRAEETGGRGSTAGRAGLLQDWVHWCFGLSTDGASRHALAHHLLFLSSQAMTGKLVRSSNDGLKYMADLRSGRIDEKMDHLVCGVVVLEMWGRKGWCVCVYVCVCMCAVSIIDSTYKSQLSVLCVVGVLCWRDVCPDKPTHGGQQ